MQNEVIIVEGESEIIIIQNEPAPPVHYNPNTNYPPPVNQPAVYPPPGYPSTGYPSTGYPPTSYPPDVYAQPAYANPVYQNVVYQSPYNNQPVVMIPQQAIIVPQSYQDFDDFEKDLLKHSRQARIATIIHAACELLFLIGTFVLIFMFLLNLLGYFGAKKFHKCLSIGYLVYLGISMIIKIIVMVAVPVSFVIVIYSILIIVDFATFVVFMRYVLKLNKSTMDQREALKHYHMSQPHTKNCCFYI